VRLLVFASRVARLFAAWALVACTQAPAATPARSAPAGPVCGTNEIARYAQGCDPPPAAVCGPVPPPMMRPFCGCDGKTYNMESAPWAHEGPCRDAGAR